MRRCGATAFTPDGNVEEPMGIDICTQAALAIPSSRVTYRFLDGNVRMLRH